jgi:hypothetical protein
MFKLRTVAVLAASLLSSSVALAATTASVTLGGTVATTLSLTVTATPEAASLDLTTAGPTVVKVADVSMSTNNEQGLTLTATSGDLTKAGGTPIPFQVTSVADGDAAPTVFAIASGDDYTVGTSVAGADAQDLYISYSPAALQDPGAYSGSITLTVTDN